MLKKLLLFLQHLFPLRSTKSNLQKKIEVSAIDSELNLLPNETKHVLGFFEVAYNESINDAYKRLAFFIVTVLIIFWSVLGVLFGINVFLDSQIDTLKANLDTSVQNLESYGNTQQLARDLTRRVNKYKTLDKSRVLLQEKTKLVMANILATDFEDVQIDATGFKFTGHCDTAFICADLIIKLLQSDKISQIAITSASLSETRPGLLIELKGDFK